MSQFYKAAYRIGFTPWERAGNHPQARQQVMSLFDRVEAPLHRPYGRALDVGCGTGTWAIELARRGWDVTGIDYIPVAVAKARAKASGAGVHAEFVEGDATTIEGVAPGFSLACDFATMHGFASDAYRRAAGRITELCSSGATLMTLVWKPASRGPLPRGLSRDEVTGAFEGWDLESAEPFDVMGLPRPLRRVEPMMYLLRKR